MSKLLLGAGIVILLLVVVGGVSSYGKDAAPVSADPLIPVPAQMAHDPGIVHVTLTEPQVWGFTAFGGDVYSASAGVFVAGHPHPGAVMFAWNTGADRPYREQYSLGRSFVLYDLSDLPQGTIVDATLELAAMPPSTGKAAKIYFYAVTWAGATPTRKDWSAPPGSLLGAVEPQERQVNFASLVGEPVPDSLRLTLRTDETVNHSRAAHTGRAFRVRPGNGPDQQDVSVLHLWIDTTP